MSKHVWECAPTQAKADRMAEAIHLAESRGVPYPDAELFAGYYAERCVQSSGGTNPKVLLDGVIRGGWKIRSGKNAANYRLAVARHARFFIGDLLPMVWDWLRNGDEDRVAQLGDGVGAAALAATRETYDEWHNAVLDALLPSQESRQCLD